MNFIAVVLMIFVGVCGWLISKQQDLSRSAKLSLFVNPLLLILAMAGGAYSFIISQRNCNMFRTFIENVEKACSDSSGIPSKEVAEILGGKESVEQRLEILIGKLSEKSSLQHSEMIAEDRNGKSEKISVSPTASSEAMSADKPQ